MTRDDYFFALILKNGPLVIDIRACVFYIGHVGSID
jgi:hypothetical protein